MHRYRGTRGVRDYIRESAGLKRSVIILVVMCVSVYTLAGALFAYVYLLENRENSTHATLEIISVFAEEFKNLHMPLLTAEELHDNSQTDKHPIIPLHWVDGIFYDTYYERIIFPLEINVLEIESNYYRRSFNIVFEDMDLPQKNISLTSLNILPTRIRQRGESIELRTRRGVFIEHGQTDEYAYIQIIDPRELYRTIVVIDAGHGGHDPGALSVHGSQGMHESEINLAILQNLLEIFDEPDILLIPTRTCDYFLTTSERTRIANSIGDYFISIHCNADSRSRRSNGTLTLYGTAEGSYELANLFQNALLTALGSTDMGVHYSELYLPRESEIPMVLLELLFQTNPQNATHLANPETQMLIAQTIADVIANLPPAR